MSTIVALAKHVSIYQDLVALVKKHAGEVDGLVMLAIASNMVGKLVAMQDQRKITLEMAMKIVADNVEQGNKEVIENLSLNTKGTA